MGTALRSIEVLSRWLFPLMITIFQLNPNLVVDGRRGIHPALLNGTSGNPGLQIRLSKRGLEYINTISSQVMDTVIPGVSIKKMDRKLPNGQGTVEIRNMKISDYQPPKSVRMTMVEPNKLEWKMRNMGLKVTGQLGGQYVLSRLIPLPLQGTLRFGMEGVKITMIIALLRTKNGKPSLNVDDCKSDVQSVSLNIDNGGFLGFGIQIFRTIVEGQVKGQLNSGLCKEISKIVTKEFGRVLESMPTEFPVAGAKEFKAFGSKDGLKGLQADNNKGGGGLGGGGLFQLGTQLKAKPVDGGHAHGKGLWLDYSLKRQPEVNGSFITLTSEGEVSWRGEGGTPFFPPTMTETNFTPNRMLYILANDYVANSLMYHAYRNGLMRFELTPESGEMGKFLKTTCSLFDEVALCLGDLIPGLDDAYPDREAELLFYPTRAPAFIFTEDTEIKIDIKGILFVFIRGVRPGKKRQVLAAQIDLLASTQVDFEDGKLTGSASMEYFDLKLKRSRIPGLDSESLDELSDLAGGIIETMANEMLSNGLPLPLRAGLQLRNPKLTVMHRSVRLELDIKVDPDDIAAFAQKAMKNMI